MELLSVYLVGLFCTAAVSGVTAVWVNRRTADRAGTVMVVLLCIHVVMPLLVVAQLLLPSLQAKILLSHLWLGLVLVTPIVWLVFAVYFTGREFWLTTPVWATLAVFGAVLLALLATEPIHGLLFVEYSIAAEPFPHLTLEWTGVTTALLVVAHVPMNLGFALLFHMHLFSRRTTWWQSGALVLGMLAILVPGTVAITPYVPIRGFPYGVFGAGVFGVVVALGLFKQGLFGVAPLARDAIFASLDDGVCVVDANHRVVDFNDEMAALFPDLESVVGDRLGDTYPELLADGAGAGEDTVPEPIRADGERDGPFASVVELSTETGARTLRLRVSTIASGGEPRGYVLVLRDVTDLEAYASELEQKTEQLEQFASVLSHDLRNPVSVAHGNVTIEQERRGSDQLATALDALERIDETIGDLLTLAKSDSSVAETEAVRLQAVVDDAWDTSDTGDGTLRNQVAAAVTVRADRSRLQRLFENLFRNAADHGSTGSRNGAGDSVEHGGVTVTVGADADGFYVADDGPGIPDTQREQVLEYGYSGGDGTGFGLSIVGSIADAHGWSLSITDSDTGGARFEVEGVDTASSRSPATTD